MHAAWGSWLQTPPSSSTAGRSTSYQRGSESTSRPSMSNSTAAARSLKVLSTCVEVLGFRMVHDDGVGRLLRVQLELLGQRDTDAVRLQQLDHLRPVLEVRAGRVAERVA